MSYYYQNRKRAQYQSDMPTKTEQSMAHDTDINVIVSKFGITGRVPGATTAPIAGDFTNIPTDLRAMIDLARTLNARRRLLPKELRDLPLDKLLSLKPSELTAILSPPAPPAPPAPVPDP